MNMTISSGRYFILMIARLLHIVNGIAAFGLFSYYTIITDLSFLDSLVKSNRLNKRADVDKVDVLDYMNILNKYNIEDKDSNAKIRFRFWKYFESILS